MIEELTPQLLMITMFLIIVIVPVLTLLASAVLLVRYRVAVRKAMTAASGILRGSTLPEAARAGPQQAPGGEQGTTAASAIELHRRLVEGPRRTALCYLAGASTYALIFATAAHFVYPHNFGLAGFLIAVWIYLWPFFLAVPLAATGRMRTWVAWYCAYFGIYAALGIWAGTILDMPGYRFGAIDIPARSSVTPEGMMRLWFAVDGIPTVMMLLCLNRWIRAVAPLMLALVTAAVAGLLAAYFAVFSPAGVDVVVNLAEWTGVHVFTILVAIAVVALSMLVLFGWQLMRLIAFAYRRGRSSDQSLLLDSLWLLFGSNYTMWLVIDHVAWALTLPLAFAVYLSARLVAARLLVDRAAAPLGLTFLRVFSLGRRSESLFERLAKCWRHVGNIQMIAGPDLATSTVQPHQFLDYLGRRLHRHFVSDSTSLQRSLEERDRHADPDGRFRVNNFFCYEDTWKAVLPELVRAGDSVLMDLRSFSEGSTGCIHELQFLVAEVPFPRCLLLVDETTDEAFLDATLRATSAGLSRRSPNYGRPVADIAKLPMRPGPVDVSLLLWSLCETVVGGSERASLT